MVGLVLGLAEQGEGRRGGAYRGRFWALSIASLAFQACVPAGYRHAMRSGSAISGLAISGSTNVDVDVDVDVDVEVEVEVEQRARIRQEGGKRAARVQHVEGAQLSAQIAAAVFVLWQHVK